MSEQMLFRRLAVFVGGCGLEAVETVIPEPGEFEDTLDMLISLVEQGLLQAVEQPDGETRFSMLETIREYALERLAAAGEDATLQRRHRDWYLTLAEQAEPALWQSDQLVWMDRLQAEFGNIWAALEWSKQQPGEAGGGLDLASALWHFWDVCGHLSVGRAQVNELLSLVPADAAARGRGLYAAGYLAFRHGDLAGSRALCEQALALARESEDRWLIPWVLMGLGTIVHVSGDADRARAYLQESLELGRTAGDEIVCSLDLLWLGEMAHLTSDHERASVFLDECLALARSRGDRILSVWALSGSARIALALDQHQRATALERESLRLRLEWRDEAAIADGLDALAAIAVAQSQHVRAARLFAAAGALRQRVAHHPWPLQQIERDRAVTALRSRLGEHAFAEAVAEGQTLSTQQSATYALGDEERGAPNGAKPNRLELSPREREVAVLISRGRTNLEIAGELYISERTAERHVENILGKLGYSSRTQVGVWAVEHGIVTPQTT